MCPEAPPLVGLCGFLGVGMKKNAKSEKNFLHYPKNSVFCICIPIIGLGRPALASLHNQADYALDDDKSSIVALSHVSQSLAFMAGLCVFGGLGMAKR